MTIFLLSVFYKPYILRFTFCIDSIAHEEFKTMRAGGLAALEEELQTFLHDPKIWVVFLFRSKPLRQHVSSS